MAVPLGTVLTPSAALGVPQRAPRLSAGVPSARPQSRRPPRAGVVAGWGRRAAPCAFTGVIARSHGRVCLRGRVDSAGRPSGCGDAAPEPAVRAGGTGVSVPAPVRGRRPWAAGFTPRKPQTPESGLLRPSEACLALPGARPPLSPQLTGVCGHHRLRPPPRTCAVLCPSRGQYQARAGNPPHAATHTSSCPTRAATRCSFLGTSVQWSWSLKIHLHF